MVLEHKRGLKLYFLMVAINSISMPISILNKIKANRLVLYPMFRDYPNINTIVLYCNIRIIRNPWLLKLKIELKFLLILWLKGISKFKKSIQDLSMMWRLWTKIDSWPKLSIIRLRAFIDNYKMRLQGLENIISRALTRRNSLVEWSLL